MILLRSLVYFVLLVVNTLLFSTPLILLRWLLPFPQRSRIANAWGRTNLWLLKRICHLDYAIQGMENIPEQNVIYMSKHQSAWETMALRGLLRPEQTWILKRELMWIPVFGWALAAAEPIAIDRKSGRRAIREIIEQGTQRLHQGRSVVVFPEGTRVAPGQRRRYGIGGAMLAERSGYPVVPIAHNAGMFWRRRGLRKYPGTIHVLIGQPIETQGLKATEIIHRVEDWIEGKQEEFPNAPEADPLVEKGE